MAELRELGTVVWLAGELAALHERAGRRGGRPMLDGRPYEQVEALYRAREPYYRQADVTVDTSGLGPDQVVAKVIAALRDRSTALGGTR
jgi:shikimate kinase